MPKLTAVESASIESGVDCTLPRHPLELIPYFRRFESGALRNLLYTLIFNTLFALFFTVVALVLNPEWQPARALWTNRLSDSRRV